MFRDKAKPILNIIALSISCFLVAHFFASFATNTGQIIVLVAVGVFIDVIAQFILALSKLRWRQKRIACAVFLFSQYIVYILAFAIPSCIGYCAGGFITQEQVENKQEYTESLSKERLRQIKNEIQVLTAKLNEEATTGYGEKSQKLTERIDKLSEEQKSLQESFKKSSEKVSQSSGKVPDTLSKVLKVPANFLIQTLFTIATWMIYLTLILTSWDLPNKELKDELEPANDVPKLQESSGKAIEKVPEKFQVSSESLEPLKVPKVRRVKVREKSLPKVSDQSFVTFVDAVIKDTGSLRGVQKVSDMVGLPVEKCLAYRESLDSLLIDGKPVISKGRGASKVNFSKDTILEYICGVTGNK